MDPLFAGIAHDERAQREGEWDGEAHVSQVKHGRMDHHLGILQQRVQASAVSGQLARHKRKRMGRKIQQQEKENLYGSDDRGGVSEKPGIGLVPQTQNESVRGQQ